MVVVAHNVLYTVAQMAVPHTAADYMADYMAVPHMTAGYIPRIATDCTRHADK